MTSSKIPILKPITIVFSEIDKIPSRDCTCNRFTQLSQDDDDDDGSKKKLVWQIFNRLRPVSKLSFFDAKPDPE